MSFPSHPTIIDLTVPLGPHTPRFPGDPELIVRKLRDLNSGDPLTLSQVTMGCHLGTHVDAPGHFIKGGQLISAFPIDAFVGPAFVTAVEISGAVTMDSIMAQGIPKHNHVLVKTLNSTFVDTPGFHTDYTYLYPEAVQFIVEELECLSIGFDYYSLDPSDSVTYSAHKIVAKAGKLAFVCLNLRNVKPGPANFIALPPRFESVEAAPVRAILLT